MLPDTSLRPSAVQLKSEISLKSHISFLGTWKTVSYVGDKLAPELDLKTALAVGNA